MKLVIDTNTIISGSLWEGPSSRLLKAALRGEVRMFLSLPMLLELREVLQYPRFSERLAARGNTAESLMLHFRAACHEAVPAQIKIPEGFRDLDDAHVLACAVGAQADVIVTGDKDLLTLKDFNGIPIMGAAEALRLLGIA